MVEAKALYIAQIDLFFIICSRVDLIVEVGLLHRIRCLIFDVQLLTKNQMEKNHEKTRYGPEQIIHKLRRAEVLLGQGKKLAAR